MSGVLEATKLKQRADCVVLGAGLTFTSKVAAGKNCRPETTGGRLLAGNLIQPVILNCEIGGEQVVTLRLS